jgi:hypothetical protein
MLASDIDPNADDRSPAERELERLDTLIADRDREIADLRRERDPLLALHHAVRELAGGRAFSVRRSLLEYDERGVMERWCACIHENGTNDVRAHAWMLNTPADVLAALRAELGVGDKSETADISF